MSKFLKKAGRAVGKVFKGVGRAVKKVVSGIVKFGKKIVKGVGKVMGKLGPIGTLAVGIIAPYALGAIAGAGMGWVSTAAQKALEFGSLVKSAVAAPFKALGQVAGKGISALGQSVGGKFATLTETMASKLGYTGGSVSEGIKNVFGEVGAKWDTLMTPASATTKMTEFGVSESTMEALKSGVAEGETVAQLGSEQLNMLAEQDAFFAPQGYNPMGIDPTSQQYQMLAEQDVGLGGKTSLFGQAQLAEETRQALAMPVGGTGEAIASGNLFDKLKKGLGSLGTGTGTGSPISPTSPVGSGYDALQSAGGEQGGGQGGLGRSFSGQEHTGFMQSEEFARLMHEGLFGQRRYA